MIITARPLRSVTTVSQNQQSVRYMCTRNLSLSSAASADSRARTWRYAATNHSGMPRPHTTNTEAAAARYDAFSP
jgi:hypothetical protein